MTSTANDVAPGPCGTPADMDMTVFELATFMCVYRAREPMHLDEICAVLGGWFECAMPPQRFSRPIARMVARGWLIDGADTLKASKAGREIARPLLGGIIRMLDQGTRLIDVALMMSVLRLTKGELDGGPDQ